MKDFIQKRKNIIIGILIFAVSFFIYTFFFKSEGPSDVLTKKVSALSQEDTKGKDLLAVLLNLNNIRLDESIFSSRLFTSLQDFTINLPKTGTTGRVNPFAPISSE
ncbi:MAG: hypothetical protein A2648_01180 [Candidatus Lloydbacteria bacterium RIFCSPHIGHO2_01_FULL_41_20]|uniref:Uncharacterized protein n=1 Tax=Candidatus Lloydbacteria bacterium RIFCSPHIGHO2_01_FULL_41_20 TaxID=1798657 RepID=A0A1G2CU25_9BACT|nr:MAG: hypothetical protein A2648_01180 [Candidatus Lloydbacteria bacterium RIFCSPHIGHO2_01_FULL_41_20]